MKRFRLRVCAVVCAAVTALSSVPVMAASLPDETLPAVENSEAAPEETLSTSEESSQAASESSVVEESTAEETTVAEEFSMPEETTVAEENIAAEETAENTEETQESAEALAVEAPSDRRTYLEGFVTRLYEKCLGRTARPDEVAAWVQRLEAGTANGADTAYGFIFSAEYKRKQTDDASYVAMLYRTILGREIQSGEAQTWLAYLERGASREWVFEGFVNSAEFTRICAQYQVNKGEYHSNDVQDRNLDVTSFVIRLYETCLGRRPYPYEQGLKDWVGWLLDGSMTGCDVAWGFLDSAEVNRKNLSEREYIALLYRALMGREPDQGMDTWLAEFDKGVSKRYVVRGFLYSNEFHRICSQYGITQGEFALAEARDLYPDISSFVKEFYQVCLGREARGEELNDWVSRLASKSSSGLDIASGFFFSNEYTRKNRSNYDFVADAYRALLGRTGTESERNDWVQRLNNGWSRETVIATMTESREYRAKCEAIGVAYLKNGWMTVGGKSYYVQNDTMLSGWQTIDGKRYYFDSSKGNAMATGWTYADGLKYYFNSDGTLCTNLEGIIGKQSSYQIKVNRQCNTVTVYAKDGNNGYIIPVKSFICSTGANGATPLGTYTTPNKYRWHELMGEVYGQWCTRIVGGVLFHSVYYHDYTNSTLYTNAYNQLGSSVSHGCVRLTAGDAKWIYDNCALGTTVIVYESSVAGPYGKPSAYTLPSWHTWDPTDPTAYSRCQARGCH